MGLERLKTFGLVARHPLADAFLINEENPPNLSIAVTLRH